MFFYLYSPSNQGSFFGTRKSVFFVTVLQATQASTAVPVYGLCADLPNFLPARELPCTTAPQLTEFVSIRGICSNVSLECPCPE